jgi:hypothetical protein
MTRFLADLPEEVDRKLAANLLIYEIRSASLLDLALCFGCYRLFVWRQTRRARRKVIEYTRVTTYAKQHGMLMHDFDWGAAAEPVT